MRFIESVLVFNECGLRSSGLLVVLGDGTGGWMDGLMDGLDRGFMSSFHCFALCRLRFLYDRVDRVCITVCGEVAISFSHGHSWFLRVVWARMF